MKRDQKSPNSAQIKKGEVFVSETDTEVIPKLCQYIYSSSQEKVPFHEVRRSAGPLTSS